jgi:hypothetical protein
MRPMTPGTHGAIQTKRRAEISADAVLAAAAVGWMAWLLLQVIDFGFGRDQGIFAVVGRTLLEGGMPYRDAWDFKPPGIFFVYALAGASVRGIRVLEIAAWISLVLAFRRLSAIYLQKPLAGTVGGMVAVAAHVQLEFWHTAQPESFGVVAIAWAMVFIATATMSAHLTKRGRGWRLFAGGVCYGLASLLKPTMGLAALGSLLLAVLVDRREHRTGTAVILTVVPAGMAAPALACVAFFAAGGALPHMLHALVGFAPNYTALGWQNVHAPSVVVDLIRRWLFEFSYLIPVGLACVWLVRSSRAFAIGLAHVSAVTACLLAGVLVQGKLFPYHFDAALPLTALLAGWGLWGLWEQVRSSTPGIAAYGVLLVLTAMLHDRSPDLPGSFSHRSAQRLQAWLTPADGAAIRERLYSVADYRAGDNRRAADWIRAETAPDAAVFVYGFTPELYIASNRRLASRYIYTVPQKATWSRHEARSRLLDELHRSRPAALLVEHDDVMPWVDGTMNDSAGDLERFAELRSVIGSDYRKEPSVGKFDVYRRTR